MTPVLYDDPVLRYTQGGAPPGVERRLRLGQHPRGVLPVAAGADQPAGLPLEKGLRRCIGHAKVAPPHGQHHPRRAGKLLRLGKKVVQHPGIR